jgi:twitching motility protein PilT
MSLVKSLLTAIVRADGDALVMHVGEKPYVVTAAGNVELSSAGLNLDAMAGMLAQLLPPDAMRGLDEFGAVEHHVQPPQGMRDAFTVVAARGGDDVWIEIRRKRAVVPTEVHPAEAVTVRLDVDHPSPAPAPAQVLTYPSESSPASPAPAAPPIQAVEDVQSLPELYEVPSPAARVEVAAQEEVRQPEAPVLEVPPFADVRLVAAAEPRAVPMAPPGLADVMPFAPVVADRPVATAEEIETHAQADVFEIVALDTTHKGAESDPVAEAPTAATTSSATESPVEAEQTAGGEPEEPEPFEPITPVVVPMRTARVEGAPPRLVGERTPGVDRLLALAASRGASVLYLTSQSRPFLRIDGDIRILEGESVLTSADVERAVREVIADNVRDAYDRGEPIEWVSDRGGVGRVRCTPFKDYRGAGILFHLISAKPISAEHLGLAREIQALASETDGLVLVSAPRGGGKSTLVAALIDVINRQHGGYVVSLEREVRIVHENRQSLISQREVGASAADGVSLARAVLRENPDVLVVEDLNTPEMVQVALDAAGSGLLVFLTVTAGSTVSALARIVELFPADGRKAIKAALADRLRGAVSQVLLRKKGGGRVAARELLVTTSAVATLVAEGQFGQLPVAMDNGRKLGMSSLTESLRRFVQSGTVDVREAYRKADDRAAFLAGVKQDGVDTLFVERFA